MDLDLGLQEGGALLQKLLRDAEEIALCEQFVEV